MQSLSAQLLQNPTCDVSLLPHGRQITSSSRFASNCDYTFLSIALCFAQPGNYLLIVDYSAEDGPLRVTHEGGHDDLPETADGAASIEFAVTDTGSAIVFNDLGNATCAVKHLALYQKQG